MEMTAESGLCATSPEAEADLAARPTSPQADSVTTAALSITLILFLMYGLDGWYVRAFLAVAAVAGLVWRSLLFTPWLWLATATLIGTGVYVERFTADNHQYLMAYWSLALALAHFSDDPIRLARKNARLLIGFAFLWATGWKIFSADFLNGRFLEFALLTDQRFAGFTAFLTGIPAAALTENRDQLRVLMDVPDGAKLVLTGASMVHPLAIALAWFTVFSEGLIALTFLAPERAWIHKYRDFTLIAFLLSIYSVATVPGFAYVLIAMGLVQASRQIRFVTPLYFGSLLITQIYTIPWARAFSQLTGSAP